MAASITIDAADDPCEEEPHEKPRRLRSSLIGIGNLPRGPVIRQSGTRD